MVSSYLRNVFPLLDIGWTRRDCAASLTLHGLGDTPESACIGCPLRSNESWAEMRATDPASFENDRDLKASNRYRHHEEALCR
ncbi:hypothetical protein ACFFN5_17070 [Streptomonospora salina]